MSIGSCRVNQTLLQGWLKSVGASVTEACDGAAGMSGCVTKPIKRNVLFERMAKAMADLPPAPTPRNTDSLTPHE